MPGKAVKDIVRSKEFIIAVVGLVFGSLIIPIVFSQIENRQKELEIKTDLIREMSTAVMNPIGMVQLFEQGRRDDTEINLTDSRPEPVVLTDERIKNIQLARLIESELRAYFPNNTRLAGDWNNIFAATHNFANLYLENDETKRQDLINQTYKFLHIPVNITVREDLSNRSISNKNDYRESFFQLQEDIKLIYDNLTRSVMTNRIPEYDWNLFF